MGGEFVCFLINRIIYTYDFGIFFHLTIYYEHSSKSIHTDLIFLNSYIIVHSVNEFSSVIQSCPILCDPTDCSTPVLSITNFQSLLKLISIESVMPSNHLILCRLLLLPSIFPSIRVFSNESVLCIRWPKYRSFSFSISPSSEYSGLISFRIDWFDPLADSQESSPTPQFKCINSSVLCFLYGPTLTSIHEYWKNHSFDYMDV